MIALTKNEKQYLARRSCAWCEMPLDRNECGAIYEQCSIETRQKRRTDCLSHYKPRTAADAVTRRRA